jgi:hypothetical protein
MSRLRVPVAIVIVVLVMAVIVIVGTVTGSTAKAPVPPTIPTAPVTSATLVCPDIAGRPTGTTSTGALADVAGALSPPSQSSGNVTGTVLEATRSQTTPIHLGPTAVLPSVAKKSQTVALTATGSVAATLAADQVTESLNTRIRALSGASCVAPATDWWFAGADGRVGYTDTLVLANPAPTPALVAVSLWGAKGPLLTARLGVVRLAPQSHLAIAIASRAPDVATIALHVHAHSGAVTAAVFDQRTAALKSDGADFLPATLPPSRSQVVSGFAAGTGSRDLVIANPGDVDATVGLRLVTATGSFVPSGASQVVVRAGHTRTVDLDRAFDGVSGAVQLSSDQPVVAQGLLIATARPPLRPDLMWLAATAPISGPAAIADGKEPDGGQTLLLLTAPQGAAQVRVSTPAGQSRTISVAAGHSIEVDITATVKAAGNDWPFVVTPIGTAPVYGVRVLRFKGATGELITGQPLVALPKPIPLPPVSENQRIATR